MVNNLDLGGVQVLGLYGRRRSASPANGVCWLPTATLPGPNF